ncbi:fz domain protein [Dictyocaulus viviparus]|uniref:Fz domain protein n=1 Tax=Dictyocaulus viviparus TaxID=29172 RepID=A0A0D8YGF9_DICVI|nr:fz domain protein [Dictyocaulus viviparus]
MTYSKGCEPITIPLCKGIGYNMTSFPNSYGHEKQEEAGLEVHQFFPLVEYGCYQHLKFFLCTLYTPICQENYDRPILPCMELCLEAKKRCSPIMQQYGFRWPETLSCESLPMINEQASGNICAAPPDTPKQTKNKVGNVSRCSYPCKAPSLEAPGKKELISGWMGIWAFACFFLSAFTFLTFLIETDRFQYPERPIFMLVFCQLMVAVGFIIRVSAGHEQVFLLTYFFGMAACVWWIILSLSWVLAAASKWSSEAISSYSTHFHTVGWLIPAAQTIVVLVFNAIDGDPVSGMCYVGNTNVDHLRMFVLGEGKAEEFSQDQIALMESYTYFLCILCSEVFRVQKQHPGLCNASKLTNLMTKIGTFSVLYTLPALFIILCLFYEQNHRPLWEQSITCTCSDRKITTSDASFMLSIVKSFCMCVMGLTSAVWVCSRKTLNSWANVLCCIGNARSTAKYQPADVLYAKSDFSSPPFYNAALRQNHLYAGIPVPDKV